MKRILPYLERQVFFVFFALHQLFFHCFLSLQELECRNLIG